MIETKHGSKEVKMASQAVKGLIQLNSEEEGKRENCRFDKGFIKMLMVSFIGLKEIKNRTVDKEELKFIKSELQVFEKKSKW